MSTPGIGDPYWYEWYVGLQQVIKMINSDYNISYVIFQSDVHSTIDDVVVGYDDKKEVCYQVKHEIGDTGKGNLTFSKLIETTTREKGSKKISLIRALALGWDESRKKEGKVITPILYTNRNLGKNKSTRTFEGEKYKALSLEQFVKKIKPFVEKSNSIRGIEKLIEDNDLNYQWRELQAAIGDDSIVIDFLKAIQIRANEGSLEDLENSMIQSLQNTFKCNQIIAKGLFDKLCSSLRIWTTTRRENKVEVTIEDVFDALSLNNDLEHGEHELPYPMPFFESRQEFANTLIKNIRENNKKVIWISGEPGSGKTSLISYLQLKHKFFTARYHTFKPISPEQKFYNPDTGLCKQESLWNDLLIQIRSNFKGELNKYEIPVTNALCTVEKMRNEVIRLAKILYEKTGEKTIVCIDGIDHAARAHNEITFLDSLFNPEEIPKGVVFVIVGQPAQFYDQYPLWIKNKTEYVEHFQMPTLVQRDIKELLNQKEINLDIDVNILAEFIYEKTKGNNLSVVFAVEEAKCCDSIEDFRKILDIKHVNADITNYYSHIWRYVSDYLNKKNLGIAFPDKVVASVIILLNGRLNSEVLSEAVKGTLIKEDWDELLELLYPLVQKTNNKNEYALFHNDFRVFLMANNSNSAKYRSIALQLAEYYMENQYSLGSLMNLIPLLISADKKDLISRVFNVEYVINSLAYGMSRRNLQEYATLAYQSAIELRDWKTYHSVYLALNTLYQHYRYFEYYQRDYKLQDKSYVKMLNSFELRVDELNKENLENYRNMLVFCEDLLSFKEPISNFRACSTFNLWTKDLSPSSFINILNSDTSSSIFDQSLIDEIMKKWASLAMKFGNEYTKIDGSIHSKEEIQAMLIFNDAYFECLLEINKTDKALEVVNNGGVSYSCIEKNLLEILFNNQIDVYNNILNKIAKDRELTNDTLLAFVCLIYNKQNIPDFDISRINKITYITNETSMKAVLLSIIVGYQQTNKDILIGMSVINNFINEIERKDEDYQYLSKLIRHGFLIGRTIGKLNKGLMDSYSSNLLLKSYKAFFSYKNTRVRSFDFKEGFKILLFLSLNQSDLFKRIDNEILYGLLESHLFEINSLGMYYKTIILERLVKNRKNDIVKKYILELYGEKGEKLFLESNYEETHECFKKYGEVVMPELMSEINEKLKWDVVSYVDHKEYALYPLQGYFKKIIKQDSQEWKTRGLELYKLSSIASIKGSNRASYEIQKEIANAAVKSGIHDIWKVRQQDEEFRFSLDILYDQLFVLVEIATDVEELISIWILSCGILSWYHKDDRAGLKHIYFKCINKGKEIGAEEIEKLLEDLSPEHVKISLYQESKEYVKIQNQIDYNQRSELEEKELRANLSEMKLEEIIEFLQFEKNVLMKWTSVNIAWDIIESRGEGSKDIAEEFTKIILSRLESYSWGNSGCISIVEKLLDILREDFLWNLAEYNMKNLNDDDNYHTCSSNMEFLLQYAGDLLSIDFVIYMFDEGLKCHYMWITGCRHIGFNFEIIPSISYLPEPKDTKELVCNILMEQILTRNIHRIEICLQGLQLLIEKYPDLFKFLSNSWESYTDEQKEYLIKLSERWSQENIKGFNVIYPCIVKEYEDTNELDKKIQLYSIIKTYASILDCNKEMEIKYEAKEIQYEVDTNYPSIFDKSKISSTAKTFLRVMEELTWESNDDIRYFLQNEKVITRDMILSKISRAGDSMLYPKSYTDLDMKILYGEEKKNRWLGIPVSLKAQALLDTDDAWIISEIPKITYEIVWNIEKELKTYIEEGSLSKCKPYLKNIINKEIPEDMEVIGGVFWYPVGSKDGVIYTETAKLIQSNILIKDLSITKALNPRAIVSNLSEEDEGLFTIEEEYPDRNGVCLTNEIVGAGVFIYGNTMLYPSPLMTEVLDIYPSKDNSLIWQDNEGNKVMYFERYVNPIREAIQEHYFRQPLMGRWLCKKTLIDRLIKEEGLTYYKADKIEMMPKLY
uniref:ATP-binding protein n=1 Tax=Bacillus cereus TaxID=1396 RepID=A0A5B9HLF0_BACCE|nr:ATP-binding protein [Bacillus cereus]